MQVKQEFEVENEAAWLQIVPQLIKAAKGRKIWLLVGELGSGKTTLARYLIQYLGGGDLVSSPTFSIVNEYVWKTTDGETNSMYHLDLYRLESVEELIDVGFEEIIDGDGYVLIEWPELATALIPDDYLRLKLSYHGNHRKVLVL